MNLWFEPASPERFRDAVVGALGLWFEDAKLGFLGEVLKRRADALGEPAEAYIARIENGASRQELGALAEELTVGETYFFRNGDQFRAFTDVVLPAAMRAHGATRRLSLLSAGCSSGEEAYTLAMLARETLAMPPWEVAIRAVDVNPAALAKAAGGRYSTWALRDTPPEAQAKWFSPEGRDFALSPEIRGAVTFEHRNLTADDADLWREEAYDAIFCRNVIMYFTPAVQQEVIGRIVRSLRPGGYLFLGHAETLRGLSQAFHLIHTHGTFYYQRKGTEDALPAQDFGAATTRLPVQSERAPMATPAFADTSWYEAIGNASKRIEALSRPASAAPASATAAMPLAGVALPAGPAWSLAGALDLMRRERFGEALDAVRAMPREAASDPDVLLLQAMLLVQGGKLAAAGEVCRTLLLQDELNAGANYVLALCFEAAGNAAAAEHHYRVASYLDPQFAMPLLHLGLLARRAGRVADARRDLEQALDLLQREEASRLLLFGGGFTRDGLIRLCTAELRACESTK